MDEPSETNAAGRSGHDAGTPTGTCPRCDSTRIRPIVWGYPEPGTFSQANLDKVVFGGCVITGDDPDMACLDCEARWTTG